MARCHLVYGQHSTTHVLLRAIRLRCILFLATAEGDAKIAMIPASFSFVVHSARVTLLLVRPQRNSGFAVFNDK